MRDLMNLLEDEQTGMLVVTMGRIVRGTLRNFLDTRTHLFTYSEDKNMVDSVFTIRGPQDKLDKLKTVLKAWED